MSPSSSSTHAPLSSAVIVGATPSPTGAVNITPSSAGSTRVTDCSSWFRTQTPSSAAGDVEGALAGVDLVEALTGEHQPQPEERRPPR